MPDYTFHTLSPIDFENLVRDLLQSELSIRLETFKVGKDGGVDLRYSNANGPCLIVQAKHYVGTGFRGLLSHLRSKEKAKIAKLQPERYLLATSVPLSPANKNRLRDELAPYVTNVNDIYGRDDLNNLLGLYPDIEKQHFKLWLSSTTVLEEVLQSKMVNQTKITLHGIRDKARLFVANRSFNQALDILKEHKFVVIAGIPGIGKTTLAQMLVLHFLRSNYEFVDVSYDISEAYSIPDRKCPRVYMYDDFLGRTSLAEKLRKNEDHRLVNFISAVRKTESSRLILTTREYILQQAQETYEVLHTPLFETTRCIVDLSQYTRPIRAQILYNHLHFSSLPRPFVKAIVEQATYIQIVDHRNYNPRIVEYMTDPMWVDCEQPGHYPEVFLRNLREPFHIWEHAFSKHLSDPAREMLLVLGTLPREVFVEDLVVATKRFASRGGSEVAERELMRALAELQGNFVVLTQSRGNDIAAFHSPSVQDFIEQYLDKNPIVYEELAQRACFFEQVRLICGKSLVKEPTGRTKAIMAQGLKETIEASPCLLVNYSSDHGRFLHKGRLPLRSYCKTLYMMFNHEPISHDRSVLQRVGETPKSSCRFARSTIVTGDDG